MLGLGVIGSRANSKNFLKGSLKMKHEISAPLQSNVSFIGTLLMIFIAFAALATSSCALTFAGDNFQQQAVSARLKEVSFTAPAPLLWKLAGASTVNSTAPWKLVIITGTPSWSQFWRPALAVAPDWLEVVVVDRPGFGASEPQQPVLELEKQAEALSVLIEPSFPDQKVILLGQSYGGPISALIAARRPRQVKALILVSAFFGDRGPTIRRLRSAGILAKRLLDRDLKNGLAELDGQAKQLPQAKLALRDLTIPIVIIHGAKDTFVPVLAAQRLASETKATMIELPKGDHFLNQCCVNDVLEAVLKARQLADEAATSTNQ
jgi:pimeloyl-ACP methyl ester carboxylesterase